MANKNDDVIEIDLLRLLQALWRKAWLIVLVTTLCGAMALGFTVFMVTPQYTASVLMYVNSSSLSLGNAKLSISQGDLTAAQSLIDTYNVILQTRTTLNDVIKEAELDCSYEQLVDMLSSEAVNGTEVFRIEVTNPDPAKATLIANTIAQILPEKIASIVEGSSARIVDTAVVPTKPTSPSYTKNTVIGALLGMLLFCGVIVVQELMDDKIHDTDYLLQTFDIPVLATIPDLMSSHDKEAYNYYYRGDSQTADQ